MDYVEGTKVKCDNCGWQKEIDFARVPAWHNKKCPECKDAIIIDDGDMASWNFIASIAHFQAAIGIDGQELKTVKIDTAEFKEKS